MVDNLKEKCEKVLRFIPKASSIKLEVLKEYIKNWLPEIKIEELDGIISKLIEEGKIYEPRPLEYQRLEAEKKEEKETEIEREEIEKEKEEKQKPIYKAYFPLGEGQGISVTLWKSNLQLQRRERDEEGNWVTTQEIALAKQILEKLYIRLPILFQKMRESEK